MSRANGCPMASVFVTDWMSAVLCVTLFRNQVFIFMFGPVCAACAVPSPQKPSQKPNQICKVYLDISYVFYWPLCLCPIRYHSLFALHISIISIYTFDCVHFVLFVSIFHLPFTHTIQFYVKCIKTLFSSANCALYLFGVLLTNLLLFHGGANNHTTTWFIWHNNMKRISHYYRGNVHFGEKKATNTHLEMAQGWQTVAVCTPPRSIKILRKREQILIMCALNSISLMGSLPHSTIDDEKL